jgi:hypothetical protein
LRRWVVCDRFFITGRQLPHRPRLSEGGFGEEPQTPNTRNSALAAKPRLCSTEVRVCVATVQNTSYRSCFCPCALILIKPEVAIGLGWLQIRLKSEQIGNL